MPPRKVKIPEKWPLDIPVTKLTMTGARIRDGVRFTIIPKETIELEGDFFLRLYAYYPSFHVNPDTRADTGLEISLVSLLSPLLNLDKLGLSMRYVIKSEYQEETNRRMAQVVALELERCDLFFDSAKNDPTRILDLIRVSVLTCGRWLNGAMLSGHNVTLDRFFDVSEEGIGFGK